MWWIHEGKEGSVAVVWLRGMDALVSIEEKKKKDGTNLSTAIRHAAWIKTLLADSKKKHPIQFGVSCSSGPETF